jgi:hypothetical protein
MKIRKREKQPCGGTVGSQVQLMRVDNPSPYSSPEVVMPIILFILLVILIAQVGFWDTLAAVLGAALLVVLFLLALMFALGIGAYLVFRKVRRNGSRSPL